MGAADARTRLNAKFVADRVLVSFPTKSDGELRFYTDTGGGGTLVWLPTVERLNLSTDPITGPAANEFPKAARKLAGALPLNAMPPVPEPVFAVPDFIAAMGGPAEADGFLGNTWFAGRIWTWDYPGETLTLEDQDWKPGSKASIIPVTFRRSGPVRPAPSFPRIVISIAGEDTSVLLDTGAETLLTPPAIAKLGGGPALRATSMIASSRFQAWQIAHPDWPVIESAQVKTDARMIRVPDVMIAGIQVGPVWFTERPDANFQGMMSAGTDAQVEGAVGGNAFRTLRMTVDYRSGRAAFERR